MVAGDLDHIVMKAIDKDRARRYASAAELAADMQRYLTNDPVEARLRAPCTGCGSWLANIAAQPPCLAWLLV